MSLSVDAVTFSLSSDRSPIPEPNHFPYFIHCPRVNSSRGRGFTFWAKHS